MEIDIENIASLARIGLTEAEKKKFSKEMENILEFIAKLNEVKTEGIEPMAHAVGVTDIYRSDEVPQTTGGNQEKLLSNAPQREVNYVKVKAILEK